MTGFNELYNTKTKPSASRRKCLEDRGAESESSQLFTGSVGNLYYRAHQPPNYPSLNGICEDYNRLEENRSGSRF